MAVDTALPRDLESARQERLAHGTPSRRGRARPSAASSRERLPQVVIARGDLETRRQAARAAAAAPSARRANGRGEAATPVPRSRKPDESPRDDVERTIAGLWREILGFDAIGVHDSFFDLGGHSLRRDADRQPAA